MDEKTIDAMVAVATSAMKNAHAPYSKFTVGAALLLKDGRIVPGCNVENASFGATVCAERTAIGAAVAQGDKEFDAVCVIAGIEEIVTPCGICRQSLLEFNRDMTVICVTPGGKREVFKIQELLPHAFTSDSL